MPEQASMFLKQNPGEAHYSVEQLQQMAESGSARSLINKISRYSANITGTHSYWHKLRDDLKAIILHSDHQLSFPLSVQLICIGLSCTVYLTVAHQVKLEDKM